MIIIKLIALFLAVLFTIVNTYRAMEEETIYPLAVLLQTIGIVVFVVIQFRLYE